MGQAGDTELKSIVESICTGNSVLFLGAGFSSGAKNHDSEPVLLGSELSRKLCQLSGIPPDDDLWYSSEKYLEKHTETDLIDLLIKVFSAYSVNETHVSVAQQNWRRVYTTNYDNVYEKAADKAGINIRALTLQDSADENFRRKNTCIHINGQISSLNKDNLNTSFKLTDSSYVNSDAFAYSSWSYRFKTDLELCNSIIFIGYSLYDIEIKRLLAKNPGLINKTYFVNAEDIPAKERHQLEKYGTVFSIGAEKFADALRKYQIKIFHSHASYFTCFEQIKIDTDKSVNDQSIRNFLLRGLWDDSLISSSLRNPTTPIAVDRWQSHQILTAFKSSSLVLLSGGVSDGKSVIASQVASKYVENGSNVYSFKNYSGDYEHDFNELLKLNAAKRPLLIFEDFSFYSEIILYALKTLGDKADFLLVDRNNRLYRTLDYFEEHGVKNFSRISSEALNIDELSNLDNLIYSSGLWGELAGMSELRRVSYIRDKCLCQLPLVLIDVLKSDHVKKIFAEEFAYLTKTDKSKLTIFTICIVQTLLPNQCMRSLISELNGSNYVYEHEFQKILDQHDWLISLNNQLKFGSSIFCKFLLQEFFASSYTIEKILAILKILDMNRNVRSREEDELFKGLMKFGTLVDIFPRAHKANAYNQFYETLKKQIPSLQYSPHYWLQYGMSMMFMGQLDDAKKIFDQAYAMANKRDQYDTLYIDNQYAKLFLRKACVESNPNIAMSYFEDAYKLLLKEKFDVHTYRVSQLYIDFYNAHFEALNGGKKAAFERALKTTITNYEEFLYLEFSGNPPVYHANILENFKTTLQSIKDNRQL